MKKFSFRLAKVLELRRKQEDSLKETLGNIEEKITNVCNNLDALTRKLTRLQERLKCLYGDRMTADDILLIQRALSQLRKEIVKEQKLLDSLYRERREISEELLEAMKKRKVLEELEDKERIVYKEEIIKYEQKIADEMTAKRFTSEGHVLKVKI